MKSPSKIDRQVTFGDGALNGNRLTGRDGFIAQIERDNSRNNFFFFLNKSI